MSFEIGGTELRLEFSLFAAFVQIVQLYIEIALTSLQMELPIIWRVEN